MNLVYSYTSIMAAPLVNLVHTLWTLLIICWLRFTRCGLCSFFLHFGSHVVDLAHSSFASVHTLWTLFLLFYKRPTQHVTDIGGSFPHSSNRGGASKSRAAPVVASEHRARANEALPRPYVVRSSDLKDGTLLLMPENCSVN